MYSQLKNLQSMKVNFRNRKVLLNFPKDQAHKVSEQNDAVGLLLISNQKKEKQSVFSNSSSSVKPQSRQSYDRIEMNNSKGSYIDSLVDTIHLIGQEYISYLNEGKEERFRAAIMSTLTNLEARDRKIIIEYNFEYDSSNKPAFDFQREHEKFKEWLGEVHFRIVSTSFDFMINKMLSFIEIKVYCSQNLLLNIILFIEKVENRIKGISLTDFMLFIDNILSQNLEYLMVKYPQAKQMKPNKRLRQEVQPINNMENDINDILQHSKVQFEFNQTENYNSEIMRFINYIIEIMTQEVDIDGEKYPFAEGFSEIMENLFQSTYLPESQDKKLKKNKLSLQNYKKEVTLLFQTNKQVKEYRQKVSKYSSYKLGTKVNPNTQLFTESEIKAGFFEVKSTSILRILTKWIEQLQRKIFQAKEYIQKRSFRFKNTRQSFSKLNASQKNDLYLQATKQIQKLKECIKDIRTNAFSIEGQLAMTMKRNKNNINIPKHQFIVGEFSSKLEDAASSSLLSYLNQIIHILLMVPKNIRAKYSHDEELMKELEIDLITFKISDLLRCKFSSHQNQILRAYRELKRLSDEKDYFKIVRIKDRLDMGTRDILINVNYMNKLLCEIQLAVTDEIDTKQQAYDAFNHFLYQLKRSNLGAIMQSACIWAHFDQRSRVYKRIKEKQIEDYYLFGSTNKVNHDCKEPLVDNDLPFVCSLCSKFYYSQQGIIKHKKCKQCLKFYHCALCLENRMTSQQLKSFLRLDKLLDVFSEDFEQWNDGQYPKFGLIIPKKNKNVEIYFFMTVLWKQDAYIVRTVETQQNNEKIVEVVIIVKSNELKQWKKLKQNYIIYEWKQTRNANKTIKPTSILRAQRQEQQKREKEQQQKKQKKQKQVDDIKKKWKRKTKRDGKQKDEGDDQASSRRSKSRPGSAQSEISRKSVMSQPHAPKESLLKNYLMPPIEEQKVIYNQSVAKISIKNQFRVAQKIISNEDEFKQTTYLVLGPFYRQRQIRAQLKKINNLKVIRQFLERKIQVMFLEDMSIEDELELSDKECEKFSNSLKKISELYLDSNLLSDVKFLELMTSLSVAHLNYNMVDSMTNFQNLTNMTELMLEYNKIQKIEGVKTKKRLFEINLHHNLIKEITGLQQLSKLQVLNVGDNFIQEISGLQALQKLRKLDLQAYNKIQIIQGMDALINLEELDLSDNKIEEIKKLENLTKLKKLNLYRNKIKKLEGLEKLTELKFLDLHRNMIVKIEKIDILKKLTYLNLSSNKIRVIEGLNKAQNLVDLNLSQNEIVSLRSLIDFNLICLKTLDLSYNGIIMIISELMDLLPKLEKFFINSNPIKLTKQQHEIHKKLSAQFQKRSGFRFLTVNDENLNNDPDLDFETKHDEKSKQPIRKLEVAGETVK